MHEYTTDMYEGIVAETVGLPGQGGDTIRGYLARPLGPGPFPGVVLIHNILGYSDWYHEATRTFAHHGYVALCPNLYHRRGDGVPEDVAAQARASGGLADD